MLLSGQLPPPGLLALVRCSAGSALSRGCLVPRSCVRPQALLDQRGRSRFAWLAIPTRERRLWSSEHSQVLVLAKVTVLTYVYSRLVSGEFIEVCRHLPFILARHANGQSQEKKSTDCPQHSPITDQQIPTAPSSHSHTTDYRSFSIIADDGKLVSIELWDFPGNIADERASQLVSNFFQAAIICYSIEDVKNLPAICDTVRFAPYLSQRCQQGH